MPEPVGGHLEFAGERRCRADREHGRATVPHLREDVRVEGDPQELVDHDVLVVPADGLLGLSELVLRRVPRVAVHHPVDDPVVEVEEGQVELRDDHVLVVARVGDDSPLLTGPRQVTRGLAIDQELGRQGSVELGRPVVQEPVVSSGPRP